MRYEAISIKTLETINQLVKENQQLKDKQKEILQYINRLLVLKKIDYDAVLITIKSILEE